MFKPESIIPPTAGGTVMVVCKSCGYRGNGKLAGIRGLPSRRLKDKKCPECKKTTLEPDPTVVY